MPTYCLPRTSAAALLALLLFGCGAAFAQQPAAAEQPATAAPQEVAEATNIATAAETSARLSARGFGTAHTGDPAAHLLKPAPDAPAPQTGGGNQANPLPPPLTAGQKMRRAFRRAFLSPGAYAITAFNVTLTQLGEDELPDKDFEDEFGDWASRFARSFATRTTRTIFASGVYPALFKQDPRYDRSQKKGFARRAGHAVSRVFVTRDDDGNVEPNYSRFAGVMTAAALANVWERSTPGHDRIGADATFRRFGRSFINDSLTNIIREFWPDIRKIIGR